MIFIPTKITNLYSKLSILSNAIFIFYSFYANLNKKRREKKNLKKHNTFHESIFFYKINTNWSSGSENIFKMPKSQGVMSSIHYCEISRGECKLARTLVDIKKNSYFLKTKLPMKRFFTIFLYLIPILELHAPKITF